MQCINIDFQVEFHFDYKFTCIFTTTDCFSNNCLEAHSLQTFQVFESNFKIKFSWIDVGKLKM